MTISSRGAFAEQCVIQGLFFGVNSHYMLGVAEMRSGIKDDADSDRIGPYRVTQQFWEANAFDADLEVLLEATDISRWRLQCAFTALHTLGAQNRLLGRLGHYPSAVELYQEQWPDESSHGLPEKLQNALDSTAALYEGAVLAVTGEVPDDIATIRKAETEPIVPVITISKGADSGDISDMFGKKAPWIMEKLMNDFDLTEIQAAGVLGNIGHECNGFRNFQEMKPLGGGKGGFGWCQWTGPRRKEFEKFCNEHGHHATSDQGNYGFLKKELAGSHKAALQALRSTHTIKDAVRRFEEKFERAHPDYKHYDRRERWAKLALEHFKNVQNRLPPAVAKTLDPDTRYHVLATVKSGATDYWLIEQFGDEGGQVLMEQAPGQDPKVLISDTSIFPLMPDVVPALVAQALSNAFDPAPAPQPPQPAPAPAPGSDFAARILAEAKACNGALVTRGVPNTSKGRLACAWAVNEVVRRALGKPVGGGLSTIKMNEVLSLKHRLVTGGQLRAGLIVMSPTQGKNVGHVGVVGSIATSISETLIYSNSSSKAIFSDHFTIGRWVAFYGKKKGLPVLFYQLR